jgi:hypothetical protein
MARYLQAHQNGLAVCRRMADFFNRIGQKQSFDIAPANR